MGRPHRFHRHVDGETGAAGLAALVHRQHGVVSRRQLRDHGLSDDRVDSWIARGRLIPLHRGVFAAGHRALTRRGRWMAAVLAAGPGGVLGYRSAAAFHGIWTEGSRVEVIVPRNRIRPELVLRQAAPRADEFELIESIPVATPARTLLDLASVLPAHRLEQAINEAEYLRLTSPTSLGTLLTRYPNRKGTKALRKILADGWIGKSRIRSEFELRFYSITDELGLPRAIMNHPVALHRRTIEADAAWPGRRLIVELDSRRAHERRAAFESDRLRDREAAAAGWMTIRVTWRQLHEGRAALASDLARIWSVQNAWTDVHSS